MANRSPTPFRDLAEAGRALAAAVMAPILAAVERYAVQPLNDWLDRRSSDELLVLYAVSWCVSGIMGLLTVILLLSVYAIPAPR